VRVTRALRAIVTLVPAAAAAALAACAGSDDGDTGARVDTLAPIESADVLVRESFPAGYAVKVTSGLPSGCAAFDRIDVERSGTLVTLSVWNTMPADSDIACTMIYGTTENTVELGSDFMAGTTYAVVINGEYELSFGTQ